MDSILDIITYKNECKSRAVYLSKCQLGFPEQSKRQHSVKNHWEGTENKSENNFVMLTVAGESTS